jgi:hypothetical protein
LETIIAGTVSTLAGGASSGTVSGYQDGTGTSAKFGTVATMVVSTTSIIYVTDPSNNVIRSVTTNGNALCVVVYLFSSNKDCCLIQVW